MKKINVLLMVVCVIGFAVAADGAVIYDIDFDHGVQSPAPDPYTASASETIPATMALYDVTAGSQLVDSGAGAIQGGESFYAYRGGQAPRSGYSFSGGPEIGGSWTMEFLVKPNYGGAAAGLYCLYNGDRLVASGAAVNPYLYIGGTYAGNHKVYWDPQRTTAPFRPMQSTTELQEDQWYHIALVLGDDVVGLYIDGALEDSLAIPDGWGAFIGVSSDFLLGSATIASSRNFRGLMDAFSVDDTALAPANFHIIPEPATLALLAMGFVAICKNRKK